MSSDDLLTNQREEATMIETIAGVQVPDSRIANDAAELIRETTTPLIYHHSRRASLFGSLQSRKLGIQPDAELLYVAALFHDSGLVPPYRGTTQRFELDSADAAKSFLTTNGFSDAEADVVWTAIALHTTPEVPYKMAPVIAATTAGVETDVLGIRLDSLSQSEIDAVTAVHPRPDFKNEILQAFTDGFQERPDTTFGTVNADVLEHFVPNFHRIDFVDVIKNSAWPE
jgi:hypothetical protein